jgi:hypothetical protein
VSAITATHRKILAEIGIDGIDPERLLRQGREFQELERHGLVVFWPKGAARPQGIFGGGSTAGRWYLTVAGGAMIEPDPDSLRLA